MSNQQRTIIGACDYSIATLQNLKRDLQEVGASNPRLNWAIGGVVAVLVSNLLKICDQVFQESAKDSAPNATADLTLIGQRLNGFIERMVTHE